MIRSTYVNNMTMTTMSFYVACGINLRSFELEQRTKVRLCNTIFAQRVILVEKIIERDEKIYCGGLKMEATIE